MEPQTPPVPTPPTEPVSVKSKTDLLMPVAFFYASVAVSALMYVVLALRGFELTFVA